MKGKYGKCGGRILLNDNTLRGGHAAADHMYLHPDIKKLIVPFRNFSNSPKNVLRIVTP